MLEEAKQFYADFKKAMGRMQKEAPNTVSGFMQMFKSSMGEGSLSVAHKECVALGIALGLQCVPCILLHVQKCLDAGLTREQILEVCGVAVMMAGGPAYTHIPHVMKALDASEAAEPRAIKQSA